MDRCPITYKVLKAGKYAPNGLKKLNKNLTHLKDFPYSAQEQRQEAVNRMQKMSIQGVQPKLSAVLSVKAAMFKAVDQHGKYIIKPQSELYNQVPENEDLSMRLAALVNIEVPQHGLIYCKDNSLSYFIKRFDRYGQNKKLAVEDFAQIAGKDRGTKYNFTLEKMIKLLDEHCTFPVIEKLKFFRLVFFNFLIGNKDMHLKNFSLIRRNNKIEFSPAYDLLNTTLVLKNAKEEMALTLAGKRSNFKRSDLVDYFAQEGLNLTNGAIDSVLNTFSSIQEKWKVLIRNSFLSVKNQERYLEILEERSMRMGLFTKESHS